MPTLGADMTEGTMLEWHVAPGDAVHRGDIMATIDTSKSEMDIEVFEDGVVEELCAEPGAVIPVGGVLAKLRTDTSERAPGPPLRPPSVSLPPDTPKPRAAPPPASVPRRRDRLQVTPVARRMAADLGVDLRALHGSGPHGAIRLADVEQAARETPPPPIARPPRAAVRDAIAQLMSRAQRDVPQYHLAEDIDLAAAMAWLDARNADRPPARRIVPAALLLAATARAARAVPDLNGFWVDGGWRPSDAVHLGVAISLRGGGLVAPAIHDADRLGAEETMERLRDLVRRARTGGLRASEMADPTLTVTNLGEQGVRTVFGVLYPPQVALVGFGTVAERPWAQNGMLGIRPVVTATLSADHRATDGAIGARFLRAVDRLLQAPEELT
jgi:pyruvate dehydrogenase E2 component (dihydrolipoamide acetyltransferase)